jgi:FlaG/FlaF family flagellin (archaellin)
MTDARDRTANRVGRTDDAARTGSGTRRRDRAVSTVVGYVLAIAITTLLISGLLITTGGVVDSRQESTARDSLRVFGQRIAANLMTADRLAETGPETAAVRVSLPDRVATSGYSITVDSAGDELVLESHRADVTVRVPYATKTPVVDSSLTGGDVRVVLTAADELEVRSA